ncbi:CAP domain-containing protein [Paracoccus sp. 1_MG-2023]|uniref:CAP domain-containing protein n=1 Tax=unclassified Paracoccus (in: a-proteobacteria) TaxID=2688777 RepID=UPI001C0A5C15|nr:MULTISPECIES: CAP domain-containing protein [unclassified Paracoccus (in: a-proteobacteria)]MBU2957039.1 CAP domain-containing protein [Paracoccus sp. C2R09]MDO6668237.1 CAP domain-containing protein [Paracoccus sp. 1_MG-2023]
MQIKAIAVIGMLLATACTPAYLRQQPLPQTAEPAAAPVAPVDDRAAIGGRVLQQINTLRGNIGAQPLVPNDQLKTAALAHARDMSAQNRAWHWGSDGSSPLDRAQRAGYQGHLVGENISESYENEIQTLSAWMSTRDTRDVIMDPAATQMGFDWYKEPSGKLWWVLLTGS